MPSIKDTLNTVIHYVSQEHANSQKTLHGGRLMDWIMSVANITSVRFAKGLTVLGAADNIDFMNPVKVGHIVVLDSWIEFAGKSSLEVAVRVYSEDPEVGEKKFITLSRLAFVAIDKEGNPRTVGNEIVPANSSEKTVFEKSAARREARLGELKIRKQQISNIADETEVTRITLETSRAVMPEDIFFGNLMSAGKLLKYTDETSALIGMRHAKGTLVTGSLDSLFFFSPIRQGEYITLKAGITHTGKTSLETAVKISSENPRTGERNHTCTAFLSFVHVDEKGKPCAVPQITAETPYEKRLWTEAEKRRELRSERVREIRKKAEIYLENYKGAVG
ncbi:acyl-CoA thioesterase [Candidatus Mycalebacterium sp.]